MNEIDALVYSIGTLGGKYTSLEGLMNDIREEFTKMNAFAMGDSSVEDRKQKLASIVKKFEEVPQ